MVENNQTPFPQDNQESQIGLSGQPIEQPKKSKQTSFNEDEVSFINLLIDENPQITDDEILGEVDALRLELGGTPPTEPTLGQSIKEPTTVQIARPLPEKPIDLDIAEFQKTGVLPEGVTPEEAQTAISKARIEAGAPEIRQATTLESIKTKIAEIGESLSPQQEVFVKDILPLVVGGVASIPARLAVKAIPAFAKLAQNSPKIAAIISSAAEGIGFETGFVGAKEQRLPTAGEAATSAALFGGIPAAGAALKTGKELVGKAIPEALVKSAIKLKPTQKIKVAKELEKLGEAEIATTAEEFIVKNRISGSPEEVAAKLAATSKAARAEKLAVLEPLKPKFKNARAVQLADEIVKAVDGVAGRETQLAKGKALQKLVKSKEGATLSQIDELKTLSDDVLSIFTLAGDPKAGNVTAGLAAIRREVKLLIEKEAAKLGVSNIKELNQNVILNRALAGAVSGQAIGAGGNALIKLVEAIGVAGVAGFGLGQGGFDIANVAKTLGTIGVVVAGAKFFNPEARIKLANFLAKNLNDGEAGAVIKFLQGEGKILSPELTEKVRAAFKSAGAKLKKLPPLRTKEGKLPGFIAPGKIAEDITGLGKKKAQIQVSEDTLKFAIDKKGKPITTPFGEKLSLNEDGTLTVFHRTTPEIANKIKREGLKGSTIQGEQGKVFVSTNKTGGRAIGKEKTEVLEFKVDSRKFDIDEVFRDGSIDLVAQADDLIGLRPLVRTATKAISKELEPLAAEARKFKTAEEFAKEFVLHGTTAENAEKILSEGFLPTQARVGGKQQSRISFSDDEKLAFGFGFGRGKDVALLAVRKPKKTLDLGNPRFRKDLSRDLTPEGKEFIKKFGDSELRWGGAKVKKYLNDRGFDSISFKSVDAIDGAREIRSFNPISKDDIFLLEKTKGLSGKLTQENIIGLSKPGETVSLKDFFNQVK